MIAYHGTKSEAYEGILVKGFNLDIINHARRFGNGVYFSDKQDVDYYGEKMIVAEISEEEIAFYNRKDWQRVEDGLIQKHQHEYHNHIPPYINKLGYKALCIDWDGRGRELIVYDLSIINIQN